MYEELIERLRHDSESRALMREAADAIEELDNLLNLYRQGKIHSPNNDLPTSAKCGGDMNVSKTDECGADMTGKVVPESNTTPNYEEAINAPITYDQLHEDV